jgi:hypothetical protein
VLNIHIHIISLLSISSPAFKKRYDDIFTDRGHQHVLHLMELSKTLRALWIQSDLHDVGTQL